MTCLHCPTQTNAACSNRLFNFNTSIEYFLMAQTSSPVQVCLLITGTSLPSRRPPVPEAGAARNRDTVAHTGREGREKDWRPFRQWGRKRNSVNPPLIRYNGSLVVCPVRTLSPQVYDTVAPDTLIPATHLYHSQQQQGIMVSARCGTAVDLKQPVKPKRLDRMFTDNHIFDQPPGGMF